MTYHGRIKADQRAAGEKRADLDLRTDLQGGRSGGRSKSQDSGEELAAIGREGSGRRKKWVFLRYSNREVGRWGALRSFGLENLRRGACRSSNPENT